MSRKTATLIKDLPLDDTLVIRKLWKFDPPVEDRYEFVVSSAVVAAFTGPETFLFGSDEQGNVQSFTELDGSLRGSLDHEAAVAGTGYQVRCAEHE